MSRPKTKIYIGFSIYIETCDQLDLLARTQSTTRTAIARNIFHVGFTLPETQQQIQAAKQSTCNVATDSPDSHLSLKEIVAKYKRPKL